MKIFSGLLATLFFLSAPTKAARIIQQKENRILVQIEEGDDVSLAHLFILIGPNNEKAATGKVAQIKKNRAILTITKGSYVSGGWIRFVIPRNSSISENPQAEKPTERAVYRFNAVKYSALLTLGQNNMVTKQTDAANPVPNTEDVSMKGTSFGLAGAIDFPFNDWLVLRGTLGYEPFNAAGTSTYLSCGGLSTTDCNANINYLSAGGFLRFDLTKSQTQFWAGLGGTLKFPFSKTTTALLASDIKTTMTFAVAGGMDYYLSNKNFIPMSLEYQMFMKSDTVSANIILLRGGYGWAF